MPLATFTIRVDMLAGEALGLPSKPFLEYLLALPFLAMFVTGGTDSGNVH